MMSAATYNGLVTGRNSVEAKWSMVLSAYEQNFVNVRQSVQVAKLSVDAQTKLVESYTALRQGIDRSKTVNPKDTQALNSAVTSLDRSAAAFMVVVQQEAVPRLDVAQLTELNKIIESTLRVVKHERDGYTDAVRQYNNRLQTFPNGSFNSMFGWGFETLRGFAPDVVHTPESSVDLGLGK